MLIRSKRHWATLLAVGLPLLVGGCAGGMGTRGAATAPEAKASTVDALTLANRLKAEGNLSSAASMYQQASAANPGDPRPLLGLGECLLAMGSNADAAQAYSAVLALQPNNLEALRGLGHARILLGQPQFALTQYQTALKIAPNDVRILNGLGVAQDMVGDHAGAQKSYHQVLAIDPANQSAKNNLALSMALAGDDAGAIKILEDVSKSATATAVNRQNLALLYGVSGKMQQAEQVSRADLPPDVVNRNMATLSTTSDDAKKQELLKESLGVELKGRQYAPPPRPITPLNTLAQTTTLDEPQPYMSGQEGAALPLITTGEAAPKPQQTAQIPTEVVVKTHGNKNDGWSDWDEELVDATDVNGGTTTAATQTAQADPSATGSATPDSASPKFLSSSNAIADDKAATTAPTPPPASKPAASSGSATATQMAALPPITTTPAAPAATEKPAAPAEKPAAAAAATPAATAAAPTMPAMTPPATKASSTPPATTAAATTASGSTDAASSQTITAQTIASAKIYTVQIASYRSEQEASAGWQTLTAEQADLLAKLPHAVAKADLGADKGIYYRLQAGSFSDRKDAKALCSDLKDRAVDCMVVEAAPTTAAPAASRQSMLAPDDSFVIGAR